MIQTITGNMADENVRKAYIDWLEHPITRLLRDQSLRLSRPKGLTKVDGETALHESGRTIGQTLQHEFIFRQSDLFLELANSKDQEEFLRDGMTFAPELVTPEQTRGE